MSVYISKIEIQHLIKAWVAISLAFAIAMFGISSFKELGSGIGIAAITVGIGFLVHELAHKVVAQRYGCFAEFRANTSMLILAIIISFSGFVFAAPGAVYIRGNVDVKRNGIISTAGPGANLVLAVLFLIPLMIDVFPSIMFYGFVINAWLAFFNMIPFGNFDGAKIMRWNKGVFAVMIIIAVTFMLMQGVVG